MSESLQELIKTVHRLRAPNGCPWDRAQTHQTLRQYLIEETYEVLDVLDRIESDDLVNREEIREPFREELGDLLMQVLLHSEMTREKGAFDIDDVARGLNDKLIRRHPHVFGDNPAVNADEALRNWEKKKAEEKASNPHASVLDGVPKGLPALLRTARMIEKVTKVGFQWKDMEGPLAKVDEELAELKVEIDALEKSPQDAELKQRATDELGDLFFTLANVAYLLKINPEDALRSTLNRFDTRFRHVERGIKSEGRKLEQATLEEMDRYWEEAKRLEKEAK